MKKLAEPLWLDEPSDKDCAAAETCLQLLYGDKKSHKWRKALKGAQVKHYAAKDLLRASGTPISEVQAFDFSKQQTEIADGMFLSPILLLRQDEGNCLIIADGFHRMGAVFCRDQEALIPCKIA